VAFAALRDGTHEADERTVTASSGLQPMGRLQARNKAYLAAFCFLTFLTLTAGVTCFLRFKVW
jgi:hypothetical protein